MFFFGNNPLTAQQQRSATGFHLVLCKNFSEGFFVTPEVNPLKSEKINSAFQMHKSWMKNKSYLLSRFVIRFSISIRKIVLIVVITAIVIFVAQAIFFSALQSDNDFKSLSGCHCPANISLNYVIKLHKPWHRFDSNHWFHSMKSTLLQCYNDLLCLFIQSVNTIYHIISNSILWFPKMHLL